MNLKFWLFWGPQNFCLDAPVSQSLLWLTYRCDFARNRLKLSGIAKWKASESFVPKFKELTPLSMFLTTAFSILCGSARFSLRWYFNPPLYTPSNLAPNGALIEINIRDEPGSKDSGTVVHFGASSRNKKWEQFK